MSGFLRLLKSVGRFFYMLDFSKISVVLVLTITVWYALDIQYWKQKRYIIAGDVLHYYAYLPATFVYQDLELKFVSVKPSDYQYKFWPVRTPIGKNGIMTTMGMSILYAPAFLVTHAVVLMIGGEADGFSPPYRLGLIIGGWVYLFLALLALRKVLLRYFSKAAVGLALLMTVLGTNLFHYETAETTMSHGYSFFLFSCFLLLTIKWHEQPKLKWAALLGLTSGLIALVRPTNALIGLVFILWNVGGLNDIKTKALFFLKQYKSLLTIIAFAILIWLPQLFYWKLVTGSYFFNGYGDDQGFFFNNPQVFNNLFSYRKGWLVYTPIMLLAFTGLGILWKKRKGIVVPLLVFSLINIYIISSWWSWWYGGGFGLRAYVESYALYALGFGAFAQWIFSKRLILLKIPAFLLVLTFIAFSYFQTRQYFYGSIHYVGMTKEAYWHQFLVLKPYGEYYKLLTIPDMDKARKGIYEFHPEK